MEIRDHRAFIEYGVLAKFSSNTVAPVRFGSSLLVDTAGGITHTKFSLPLARRGPWACDHRYVWISHAVRVDKERGRRLADLWSNFVDGSLAAFTSGRTLFVCVYKMQTLGDFDFEGLSAVNMVFANIFLWPLVLLGSLVILNIVLAAVLGTYDSVVQKED